MGSVTDRTGRTSRRFSTPTDFLRLEDLLRRQRPLTYAAVAVALVLLLLPITHLALREEEKKVHKPLVVHLVVRKPRMTKPFEFEKRQMPKRQMTRQVRAAKPQFTHRPQIRRSDLVGKIRTFQFGVDSGAELGMEVVRPDIKRVAIESPKEPDKRISMQEEFLDLEALDIGRYKGLVIQDPSDKQNITGFVYLALAWANDLQPPTQRAVFELVEAINDLTQIRAEVDNHLFLDSREIFRAPFVYIAADQAFEPTEREMANLGDYLRQGGFALVEAMVESGGRRDAVAKEYTPAEASLRQMLKGALGRDARFRVLPEDHPVYHSFYDFDDGPPPKRSQKIVIFTREYRTEKPFLEGIFLGDRLVVVLSTKEYGRAWEKEFRNEPQLQIGVNMVVFAMTQQGSIAQQQIDFYTERTK